jgi:hypothetical protein
LTGRSSAVSGLNSGNDSPFRGRGVTHGCGKCEFPSLRREVSEIPSHQVLLHFQKVRRSPTN